MSPRLTSDLDIHAHTCALYTGIHEQTNEHPAVHVPHTYPLRPRKDFSFRCRSMNAKTVLLGFSNVNKEMKCGVLCHVGEGLAHVSMRLSSPVPKLSHTVDNVKITVIAYVLSVAIVLPDGDLKTGHNCKLEKL